MRVLSFLVPGLYLTACVASVVAVFLSSEALTGLYVILLAWPWTFLFDLVGSGSFVVNIAIAVLAFGLNAAILHLLFRLLGRLISGANT